MEVQKNYNKMDSCVDNCKSFMQQDTRNLLLNRFVVIIGDSVQRGVYKDLVMLLTQNNYLRKGHLRAKGEYSFEGDELIEGGCLGKMTNGINYREVRQFNSGDHLIRFYFVTRCYNNYVESILMDLKQDPQPDIVIMNSCLWDITRYGRDAINEYKENLSKTIKRFKEVLPTECLFIWNCTLPISSNARGGFLIPEIAFMNSTLRLDIIEANYFAREILVKNEFDVLDLHYHLRSQLHRRSGDGIHWDCMAHRRITNLMLNHISKAWKVELPSQNENKPSQSKKKRYVKDNKRQIDFTQSCQGTFNNFYEGPRYYDVNTDYLYNFSSNGTKGYNMNMSVYQPNYNTRNVSGYFHEDKNCNNYSQFDGDCFGPIRHVSRRNYGPYSKKPW